MDLIKIGKFIASCRKEKNITQEELAEKLYITDRAVSKWERGLSLPDADKMLELCNILDINVNDLLNGERVKMKEYSKKADDLLVELTRQEEKKNKRILMDMWVLVITTGLFYIGILTLGYYAFGEGPVLGTIIVISTLVLIAVCFYGLKLEIEAGYYECNKCHHKFVPKYFVAMISPHMSTTRFMKCPNCGKRSWCKKSMSKEK